jgi:hypothetical protein
MSSPAKNQFTIVLTAEERTILQEILEEELKETEIEEHRTDMLRAKGILQAREKTIQSMLQKIGAGGA